MIQQSRVSPGALNHVSIIPTASLRHKAIRSYKILNYESKLQGAFINLIVSF